MAEGGRSFMSVTKKRAKRVQEKVRRVIYGVGRGGRFGRPGPSSAGRKYAAGTGQRTVAWGWGQGQA